MVKITLKTVVFVSLTIITILSCSKDDKPQSAPAKFSIDQSTVDFGEVEIPTSKEVKLTVTNNGEEDLGLKKFTLSGSNSSEFGVNASETEETVQAGKTYEFTITFKPTEDGDKTATLTITSNVGEHKINLSGKSYNPNASVSIPDANFKASLLGQGTTSSGTVGGYRNSKIDTNDDGEIQISEARAYKGAIISISSNINNLTGIEAFINLKALWVAHNQLTNLDVSNNTALEYLTCDDNELTNLDVSKSTALVYLECSNNQLTNLDLSKNTDLHQLICYENQLSGLDVSNNTSLNTLFVNNNQISSLDVSKNTALERLRCNDNQLSSLNVTNSISLNQLQAQNNQLTNLDVSKNTALKELTINGNELTSLDVSKAILLQKLYCADNKLANIDISQNTSLGTVYINSNQLSSLNVANGNNASLINMHAWGNPDLTCIKIDSGFTPPAGSWSKDDTANYSSDCL